MRTPRADSASADWRLHTPDDVLLRRFGLVRAVGGAAYIVAVLVLFAIFGWQVWPLLLGVPVLAVVTTGYFVKSADFPRTSVIVSLVADAVVLGGAVSYLGGTGSGLVLLYAIVLVSAGILLGPSSAASFTGFVVFLAVLQLVLEQLGVEPALLHRPELSERLPILLASIAGLMSVGYLSGVYANRLHQLIALSGEEVIAVRERAEQRRSFVQAASVDVRRPLEELERLAEVIESSWDELAPADRRRIASRIRMGVVRVDADVAQVVDVGVLDATLDDRLQPVALRRVVEDVLIDLSERLQHHIVHLDVETLKVLGNRRAARRVVFNVLENIADHTPVGTEVHLTTVTTGGHGVLVVTDDGPGVDPRLVPTLFAGPTERGEQATPRVGLPLARLLAEQMRADVRYEAAPSGGARFAVAFRLAPASAPSDDDPEPTLREPGGA